MKKKINNKNKCLLEQTLTLYEVIKEINWKKINAKNSYLLNLNQKLRKMEVLNNYD